MITSSALFFGIKNSNNSSVEANDREHLKPDLLNMPDNPSITNGDVSTTIIFVFFFTLKCLNVIPFQPPKELISNPLFWNEYSNRILIQKGETIAYVEQTGHFFVEGI